MGEGSEDQSQYDNYKKHGGSEGMLFPFFHMSDGKTEETISTDSKITKISVKVCPVKINRPWLDLAALKIKPYTIPGFDPGSWSTGELNCNNQGLFPMLSTQMIVAKDITVTSVKFSKEAYEPDTYDHPVHSKNQLVKVISKCIVCTC